jgi:acetate kinase
MSYKHKSSHGRQNPYILVINVGSSSVKCSLYHGVGVVFTKHFERIDKPYLRRDVVAQIRRHIQLAHIHLDAIVHRVVHGGHLKEDMLITSQTIEQLKRVAKLAPLHDIAEIEVIEYCQALFEYVPTFAVFDTAFHTTMPDYAKTFAIPYQFTRAGIHKYGFHGISHEFVSRDFSGKVISCHLGSGASLCAIKNGKSIDTTMGFTPLDGLVMGTRSGSIDPGVISYLQEEHKLSVEQLRHMLNNESGLLGISGISSDVRDLLKRSDTRAELALSCFVYSVVSHIGQMVSALNGVDTIIFTAGIGERSPVIRERICDGLSYLGVKLDSMRNRKIVDGNVKMHCISTKASLVSVFVVPTNEEKAMCLKAQRLLKRYNDK